MTRASSSGQADTALHDWRQPQHEQHCSSTSSQDVPTTGNMAHLSRCWQTVQDPTAHRSPSRTRAIYESSAKHYFTAPSELGSSMQAQDMLLHLRTRHTLFYSLMATLVSKKEQCDAAAKLKLATTSINPCTYQDQPGPSCSEHRLYTACLLASCRSPLRRSGCIWPQLRACLTSDQTEACV